MNGKVRYAGCWRRCSESMDDPSCADYAGETEGSNALCATRAELDALCASILSCHSVTLLSPTKGFLNGEGCRLMQVRARGTCSAVGPVATDDQPLKSLSRFKVEKKHDT